MSEQVRRVAALFDSLAADYDQSGVAFFQPIAEQLVALMVVRSGEQALDIGCGRGAATLRLAEAVGAEGSVTAVDLAPAMVEHTRAAAAAADLPQVLVEVMDASQPALPEESFDLLLTSSLVLFFLSEPDTALTRWLRLLRPGGRAGVTTFGDYSDTFHAIDALFRPYLPPEMLDARTSGQNGPFESDTGMEQMSAAGAVDVRTVRRSLEVRFADASQWRAWSMSTGQRMMWGLIPEADRSDVFAAAGALLEEACDESGEIVLRQDVRHTLGRRPEQT